MFLKVFKGGTQFSESLLKCDGNAKKVVNLPALVAQHIASPMVTEVNREYHGMVK